MVEGQLKRRSSHGDDPAMLRSHEAGEHRAEHTTHQTSLSAADVQVSMSIGATVSSWHVVRTKTKCEKFVRDRLQAMGLEAFVPLRKRTAKYNRKVKVYELPLITCYTFVRLDKTRRNQVLALPYVQGMLRTDGRDCLVSDREIQWLQKISGTEMDVKTEPLSMRQGDRVVLAVGQLAGMEGVVLSQRSKHEVVVALESIGLQMVIQVDTAMLEPVW